MPGLVPSTVRSSCSSIRLTVPLLSTTIGFLDPIAIAFVNGICQMYRSGISSMSRRASAARCDAHMSGI